MAWRREIRKTVQPAAGRKIKEHEKGNGFGRFPFLENRVMNTVVVFIEKHFHVFYNRNRK